jgi:hypothetical protein
MITNKDLFLDIYYLMNYVANKGTLCAEKSFSNVKLYIKILLITIIVKNIMGE